MDTTRFSPHSGRIAFGLVFAAALLVRAVYILQIESSPLFAHPVVDGRTYVLHAESLAAGNWLGRGQEPFWQPPLYPYLLGAIKTLAPDSFFSAIRWVQTLCGALSCGLVYLLGARFFTPGIGLAAGLGAALYGPLIFFDGEILPTSLAMLLNLLGLLLLDRAQQRESVPVFFGAGLVFGLATLAVATILSFVGAAAGWLYWRQRAWTPIAAFALGALLAIAPVTWRNYVFGDDLVPISYNAGVNFYIGNNAHYERTVATRPGWAWEDLVGEPAAAGIKRPAQKSAYFWAKAGRYILAQPLDWLGLIGRKGLAYLSGDEVGRNQDIYYWRQYSSILAATLWKWGLAFPFGLIGPLAFLGLALVLRERGLDLVAVFVLAYSAGIIAFFPMARYRVAVVPLLLILAAYAGGWLWSYLRSNDLRRAALPLVALAAFATLANIDAGPMNMAGDAEIHYNLGQAYAKTRQMEAAQQAFTAAVTRDSTYWQAWLNLGSVRAFQGDMGEAAEIFRRVAQAQPRRPEVWVNLAHSYMGLRHVAAAVEAYQQALAVNPRQPRIYAELLQVHFQRGALTDARQVLAVALETYPRDRDKLMRLFEGMRRQFSQPGP